MKNSVFHYSGVVELYNEELDKYRRKFFDLFYEERAEIDYMCNKFLITVYIKKKKLSL